MKWFFAVVALAWMVAVCGVRAQGLDNQYVTIYNLVTQGDALDSSGQSREALAKYAEAQAALQNLKNGNPDWNVTIVRFRLEYLADKIAGLKAKVGATAPPTVPSASTNSSMPSGLSPATGSGAPVAPADWEDQLNTLKGRLEQAQAELGRVQEERGLLQAKLREAFSLQPAAVDPAELAKAQQQIKSLQKENDLLIVTLDSEKSKKAVVVETNALQEAQRALADASQQLMEAKHQNAVLSLEQDALEARLKALALATNTPLPQDATGTPSVTNVQAPESENLRRIRLLEQERDDLQQKLQAAQKEAAGAGPARIANLESQAVALRARLESYEARPVPYTTEELALFKKPQPKLPEPGAKPRSIQELSPTTASLVVEAKRYFQAGQYDRAEATYAQAVQQNGTNVSVLANLAAVQVARGRFDAADENLKQALALNPDNAYSLFVLGNLKFRQAKYDEALDALSRAAKVDPQNAEVQNFLGLTLSEKGMRIPAETALRRAVEIDPNYASAHNNLAVVYVSQNPPAVELARLHYQKALAAGAPRNAELEKMIEEKGKGGGEMNGTAQSDRRDHEPQPELASEDACARFAHKSLLGQP